MLLVLGALTPFAHDQDGGVEHAVGGRLQLERRKPLGPARGDQLATLGLAVEVLTDDRAVEKRRAVLQHERRHLAERVVALEPRGGIGGVGLDQGELVGEPLSAAVTTTLRT